MFCENCGRKLTEKEKFCVQCGSPVDRTSRDTPPSETAQISYDDDIGYTQPTTPQQVGSDKSLDERATVHDSWPSPTIDQGQTHDVDHSALPMGSDTTIDKGGTDIDSGNGVHTGQSMPIITTEPPFSVEDTMPIPSAHALTTGEQVSTKRAPGFIEGVFPRFHLGADEEIIWEGRPSLIGYILYPIIWTIVLPLVLPLFYEFFFFDEFFIIALAIVLIAGPLTIVVRIIQWRKTAFALTNRRVMTQYGVFSKKFADCRHEMIQNSTILEPFWERILGFGGLLFSTAASMGGINTRAASKMQSSGGGIYWNVVKQPAELYRHTQDIINVSRKKMKEEEFKQMADVFVAKDAHMAKVIAATPVGSSQPAGEKSIEQRLAELETLKTRGLINEEEYNSKRKMILESL